MASALMPVIFLLFLVSGFCGLLYQVIWIRMAFASFGVITPVLSTVVSVFMLGLALGSWAAGRWIESLVESTRLSAIWYYGLTELLIGVGGLAVPLIFSAGDRILLPVGQMDSFRYLFLSSFILGLSILPWCFFMGTTFPLMMSFMKEVDQSQDTSFSYLYLANVMGAMCGAVITACILIELLGFHRTLVVAAVFNFGIAGISFFLGLSQPCRQSPAMEKEPAAGRSIVVEGEPKKRFLVLSILFTTGFVSMAMEVIWTRAFTPVLNTTIYAFASLLAVYLLATWMGSLLYRRQLRVNQILSIEALILGLAVFSFLPVVFNDPRLPVAPWLKIFLVLVSIFPLCVTLGYLTPGLIDRYSLGCPRDAGNAYAINILGCILGPVFAGYVLLPSIGVRVSMILLTLVFLVYYLVMVRNSAWPIVQKCLAGALSVVMLVYSSVFATSYEDGAYNGNNVVRRDYVATVISTGAGLHKRLLVNGIGMTALVPVTKVMAHLPLAVLPRSPESAIVICFGMGTTYRSMMNWDIDVTGVELVPSVRDAFGYYFDDADDILKRPNGRIIIDDGRRYLKRTPTEFDVITIDPPPPVEAAGSSLLYSREFYELLKTRLKKDGIVQQWFPGGEEKITRAVVRSLRDVFPHVRVFASVAGWGFHCLASMQPFSLPTADEFVKRMPERARIDLVEWSDNKDSQTFAREILSREIPLQLILDESVNYSISDDRPFNEYFLMRRLHDGPRG